MLRAAINGMGRIGRAAFKIVLQTPQLELVAVNDLISVGELAYLLKYDTVYGRYEKPIEAGRDFLEVNGIRYHVLNERDPARLPWSRLDIDLVLECSGAFTRLSDLEKHIHSGAKTVLLSAPSKSEEVVTVVHGVNAPGGAEIISCASCTTNCITPVMEILSRRVGIRKAIMTTVHAYTASQNLVDGFNKDPRRGRAGACNLVPASTGAAVATCKALPECAGKFDGVAIRAPVPAGSIADITALTERATTVEEINAIFEGEASAERYSSILGVTREPLVSTDIIQDPRASVVDLSMTKVVGGDLVKVMSWYDNEWGYAGQMVRAAVRMEEEHTQHELNASKSR